MLVLELVSHKLHCFDTLESFLSAWNLHVFEESMDGNGWNSLAHMFSMSISFPLKVVVHARVFRCSNVDAPGWYTQSLGYRNVASPNLRRRIGVVYDNALASFKALATGLNVLRRRFEVIVVDAEVALKSCRHDGRLSTSWCANHHNQFLLCAGLRLGSSLGCDLSHGLSCSFSQGLGRRFCDCLK